MVYKRTACTSKHIRDVLPGVMSGIGKVFKDRPDLIVNAWPEVVGSRLAPQTRAVSFVDGFLNVKVKNSTLLSLLTQDKRRVVQSLRAKFPKTKIKSVVFRLE